MRNLSLAIALALAPLTASADALDDARAAYHTAWEAAPLRVDTAIFVTEPAPVYGMARDRGSNVFAAGEPVHVYLEPAGYGWQAEADENVLRLTIALKILTSTGQQLFMNPDFMQTSTRSLARQTEYYVNVPLNLSGIGSGEYVLEFIFSDAASDEVATVSLPIVVQ